MVVMWLAVLCGCRRLREAEPVVRRQQSSSNGIGELLNVRGCRAWPLAAVASSEWCGDSSGFLDHVGYLQTATEEVDGDGVDRSRDDVDPCVVDLIGAVYGVRERG